MRMKAVILFLCVTLAAFVCGCGPEVEAPVPEPAEPEAPEEAAPVEPEPVDEEEAFDMAAAEEVFVASCTSCHPRDRIDRHAEVELEDEPWDVIVTRMIEQNGADISPEDRQIVLKYLEAKYAE